jgi:hypothetical protein
VVQQDTGVSHMMNTHGLTETGQHGRIST